MIINEDKKDPNYIYSMERNIKAYMFYMILILAIVSILLALALIFLTPLKETKPYLLFFANGQSNFVRVQEANANYRPDEILLKSILAGYVVNRELINRIDDMQRYEIIRTQSSSKVWTAFENLVNTPNSIYTTEYLQRNIQIINVTLLNEEVATVDFMAESHTKDMNQRNWKKYRASILFSFEDSQMNYNQAQSNPTGFTVQEYALSDIVDNQENENK